MMTLASIKQRYGITALLVFAAVPWLFPFSPPPTAYAYSWIIAGYCLGGALLISLWLGLDRRQFTHHLVWGWLVAGLLNGGIVVMQYLGLRPPDLPDDLQQWLIPTNLGFPFGHLRQRNHAATFLSMALCALFYVQFSLAPHERDNRRVRGLAFSASALIAMASALTGSRIGLIGVLLLLLVSAYASWRRPWLRATTLGLLIGYTLGSFFVPWLLLQGHTELTQAGGMALARIAEVHPCDNRFLLWRNIAELISQYPWTGWGLDNLSYAHYATAYTWGPVQFPAERLCSMLDNAHNLPLHIAVELGIPAAAAFVFLVCFWVFKRQPWRESDPQKILVWIIWGLLVLHSLLEYPLWYGHFFFAMLLCVWRIQMGSDAEPEPKRVDTLRNGIAFVALGLVLICNYIQYDYNRVAQLYKPIPERSPWYFEDPFGHAGKTWLFERYVLYAQISRQAVTSDNAQAVYGFASQLIHRLPDYRVVSKLIESAEMLGRTDEAAFHTARFKDAYPDKYEEWVQERQEATQKAAASAASQTQTK